MSGILLQTGQNEYDVENNPSSVYALNILYAGPGAYDVLLNHFANNLTLVPAADNTYQIEYLKYGYGTQDTFDVNAGYAPLVGNWEKIGQTNGTQSGMWALDSIGLGLPNYLWN